MSVDGSARQQLATQLSSLRESANQGRPMTFRQLAERTHFGAATLNKAATGREVPTWPVMQAFVTECGEDPEAYRELWEHAKAESLAPAGAGGEPETTGSAGQPAAPATATGASAVANDRNVPRSGRPRWVPWLAAAAVLVLVVVAVVVTVVVTRSTQTASPGAGPVAPTISQPAPAAAPMPVPGPPPAAPASAEITSPAGDSVGFEFLVSGTVAGAPPTGTLWEVTVDMENNRFYPLNRPCAILGDDQFNCGTGYAGGEEAVAPGYRYQVLVVDATPDAVNAFTQFRAFKKTPAGQSVHGMDALPPGARIIGQKAVTRS